MGSDITPVEGPIRQVTVDSFALGTTEVTQWQYWAVMGTNPSDWVGADLPVGDVGWYQAVEFLNRLSLLNGLQPAYQRVDGSPVPDTPFIEWNRSASGYRLATEAEWEYAAVTGGGTSPGDLPDGGLPVGELAADSNGLRGLVGSVNECVWDWNPDFRLMAHDPDDLVNPTGESGNGPGARVIKGGSWFWPTAAQRLSARIGHIVNDEYSHVDFGFRIAAPTGSPAPLFPAIAFPDAVAPVDVGTSADVRSVTVEGGSFRAGRTGAATITVSGFEILATEVTQAQWESLMGAAANISPVRGPDLPVTEVTWYDAVRFANALSIAQGLEPAYVLPEIADRPGVPAEEVRVVWDRAASGWRLPTNAEWEFAARAGTSTDHYGGNRAGPPGSCAPDQQLEAIAWTCHAGVSGPQPVVTRQPNAWGIYDMIGNVSEWTWDWFGPAPTGTFVDPTGPDQPGPAGRFKSVRGGSWLGSPALATSWGVGGHIINVYYGHEDYGIRLVRSTSDFQPAAFDPSDRFVITTAPALRAQDGSLVCSITEA